MTSQDSQTRTDTLEDSIRRELSQTVQQLINCARSFATPLSGESLLHLEWFARFSLETQFAPALLAAAAAICDLDSTKQSDSSTEDDPTFETLRGLVARIQTRPLLEMDSEFEMYMFDKYRSMLRGAQASAAGQFSREHLATGRFDEKISEFRSAGG